MTAYRYFRDVPGGTLIRHRPGHPYEERLPSGEWALYPIQPPDQPRWVEEVPQDEARQLLWPPIFPPEDVEAALSDSRLQAAHSQEQLDPLMKQALDELRDQSIAQGADPEAMDWIYFSSPAWTWEHLCGREGWLLYDRQDGTQHAFWMTVMN